MARYTPGNVTTAELNTEFQKIAQALDTSDERVTLEKIYAAPKKFREGTICFADGATWNPGAGIGFYGYHSGTWNKLG